MSPRPIDTSRLWRQPQPGEPVHDVLGECEHFGPWTAYYPDGMLRAVVRAAQHARSAGWRGHGEAAEFEVFRAAADFLTAYNRAAEAASHTSSAPAGLRLVGGAE